LVEERDSPPVVSALIRKGLIFDFATEYYYSHEAIAPANEFTPTEAEVDAFMSWLKDKEYDYTTPLETAFNDLMATAKDDARYNDLQASLNQLKAQVSHDKVKDVAGQRQLIAELLKEEIARRYYLEQGGIQASFTHGPDMQAAIKVLNDPQRYESILAGPQ